MPIPPWAVEVLQRSLADVASRANPETIDKIRNQVRDAVEQIPAVAARGIDTLMSAGEAGRESVRKWTHRYTAVSRQVINATGTLMNPDAGIPLSSAVIATGLDFLDGSRVAGPGFDAMIRRSLDGIDSEASSGDLDVAIAHRLESAVAAIPLMIGDRSLLLHRSQAVRLPDSGSAADLIASLGFSFTEVGAIDAISPGDFAGQSHYATVVIGGDVSPSDLGDGWKIQVLPVATRHPIDSPGAIPSIEDSLASGFDVVIATPQGLMGGPPTGMIFGSHDVVESVRSHALWQLLGADLAGQAMTAAALAEPEESSETSTVPPSPNDASIALIAVTEENLDGRAQRMAIRFRGHDEVESAEVSDHPAAIDVRAAHTLPSRQVRIRVANRTASELVERWMQSATPLAARVDGEDAVIDLRWIPAASDRAVAEAIFPTSGDGVWDDPVSGDSDSENSAQS